MLQINNQIPRGIRKWPGNETSHLVIHLSHCKYIIFYQIEDKAKSKEKSTGTSLVVEWLRIRLPMQGTRVRALVWEDPTCRGATKPVRHNY